MITLNRYKVQAIVSRALNHLSSSSEARPRGWLTKAKNNFLLEHEKTRKKD